MDSMRKTIVIMGHAFAVYCCCLVMTLTLGIQGQRLPSRDEDNFLFQRRHPEVLYDTHTLPDGHEITAFMRYNIPTRYYFYVEEENSALSVVVTPCISSLTWLLTFHDLGDDGSADGLRGDDDTPPWFPREEKVGVEKIREFSGYTTASYLSDYTRAGLYSLVLTATQSDSNVKIYTSTTPYSDHPYPQLPNDQTIKVMRMTTHKVTITWKSSVLHGIKPHHIDYCVSVSVQSNSPSLCAARSRIGLEKPPTAPPLSGFGFAWERNARKPERPASTAPPGDSFLECVGNKTAFAWSLGLPSIQYFFDVFAVNRGLNTSSAYIGTNLTMPVKRRLHRLKDGKLYPIFMKRTLPTKILRYYLAEAVQELVFLTQACTGQFSVRISKNGQLVKRLRSKFIEYTRVNNATAGRYDIRITSRNRGHSMNIFVSSSPGLYPYPELPANRSLQVDTATCNSMIVSWHGTSVRQQYCLFLTAQHGLTPNRCALPSKEARKIACVYHKVRGSSAVMMSAAAQNLQPNTTYATEVYVKRGGSIRLALDPLIINTQELC